VEISTKRIRCENASSGKRLLLITLYIRIFFWTLKYSEDYGGPNVTVSAVWMGNGSQSNAGGSMDTAKVFRKGVKSMGKFII